MVHEDAIPDVHLLGATFKKVFKRKRPLRPERRERKRASTTMLADGQVNLLVNVVRAYNVPVRTNPTLLQLPMQLQSSQRLQTVIPPPNPLSAGQSAACELLCNFESFHNLLNVSFFFDNREFLNGCQLFCNTTKLSLGNAYLRVSTNPSAYHLNFYSTRCR